MSTSLTTRTTLGLMPLAIGILLRHYYDKVLKDKNKAKNGDGSVPLRLEELMYDEAFTLTRNFMDSATNHTVEELQQFANMHTPAGPSSHVVRLTVPQSCCAEAARVLVRAFGGEDEARRVVGGVRWWQVRPGDGGLDAEWVTDKRDWKEAKRREKAAATAEKTPTPGESASGSQSPQSPSSSSSLGANTQAGTDDPEANAYHSEMDQMRCLLWAHGGGYYFGSVNQERYMIQRYARKMHGRVFAPKYRLSPQYPFPCALQDLLASYLFLIQPPPEAAHRPVKPSHIVVGGDSAGGGLALAFLQAVRDSGLPPPAGGVLVSPWCDLHHSFPSIVLNTDTDIVPATGLTIYKPSPLWPPPPNDVNQQVYELLRNPAGNRPSAVAPPDNDNRNRVAEIPIIRPEDRETVVRVTNEDGTPVEIRNQIQLYTTNDLLIHPLVSPALAYLGGLPPLFFIASDREVLRDEIVYTAHRAANPEKYPVSDAVKKLYPAYEGIDSRTKPTMVHLQVYDDAAHVIPMMFIATNPAKYCYRAITTFIKHVTNMPPTAALQKHKPPLMLQTSDLTPGETVLSPMGLSPVAEDGPPTSAPPSAPTRPTRFSRMTSFRRGSSLFSRQSKGMSTDHAEDDALAGDPVVYDGGWAKAGFPEHDRGTAMIRERISTHGVVRPLEPEPELLALHIDSVHLGIISARWAQVY
ncbi:Alpha/Beta hydrolase fold, partial [Lactarius tabidus]